MDIWKKSIQSRRNSRCRDPEVDHAWCFQKTTMARRSMWLQENEQEVNSQ